jgi:amidase
VAGGGGVTALSAAFAGASESAARPKPGRLGELFYQSATKLAERIRTKQVSSEEVVKAHIARIREVNPKINAVVYLAEEQAIAGAREADKAIAAGKVDWHRQPLFGVPVSFKDNLETRGLPTIAGAPALRNNVPNEDATVVRKMKEAGAILLAKTNLPFLGCAFDTSNLVHGQTSNPYDLSRIPGGSSGGEGSLIAAGGSPLGIGNDASGSIRVPSHFCGIAGLCPAWGRVSVAGNVPLCQNIGPFFWANGPMARRVEDLGLALSIIAGWDFRDPFTFPLSSLDTKGATLKGLRIAYFTDTPGATPVDAIQTTVALAAEALAKGGGKVVNRRPLIHGTEKAHDLIVALAADNVMTSFPKLQKEYGGEKDPLIRELVDRFPSLLKTIPPDQVNRLKTQWPRAQRDLLAFMQDFDAVLCPVCTHPAMKHGTVWDHVFQGAVVFTELFSLVGSLPKGVVRCGTSPEGLPIGVQVVGAPWRDDIVLAVLDHLEQEFGGWRPPKL